MPVPPVLLPFKARVSCTAVQMVKITQPQRCLMTAAAINMLKPAVILRLQSTLPTSSPTGGKGRARARVSGQRLTSSVRRGSGGFYLYYNCLKEAKGPARTVYRSREAQVKVWEVRATCERKRSMRRLQVFEARCSREPEYEHRMVSRVLQPTGPGVEREGKGSSAFFSKRDCIYGYSL